MCQETDNISLFFFCKNTTVLYVTYVKHESIGFFFFFFNHGYGILLVLYLPLIHKIDQAPSLLNRGHQRAQHSHSHSQLPLPLRKSGTITPVASPVLTPTAIHSPLALGSCYRQTARVSKGPWAWIRLSGGRRTLPGRDEQVSSVSFNRAASIPVESNHALTSQLRSHCCLQKADGMIIQFY